MYNPYTYRCTTVLSEKTARLAACVTESVHKFVSIKRHGNHHSTDNAPAIDSQGTIVCIYRSRLHAGRNSLIASTLSTQSAINLLLSIKQLTPTPKTPTASGDVCGLVGQMHEDTDIFLSEFQKPLEQAPIKMLTAEGDVLYRLKGNASSLNTYHEGRAHQATPSVMQV